jgi:hypothetical protein
VASRLVFSSIELVSLDKLPKIMKSVAAIFEKNYDFTFKGHVKGAYIRS